MNRNRFLIAFSLMLVAGTVVASPQATTSTPAVSQSTAHSKMQMDHSAMGKGEFIKLDKNHDGKLAKSEVPIDAMLAQHFGMLDLDKDGSLAPAEFARFHGM